MKSRHEHEPRTISRETEREEPAPHDASIGPAELLALQRSAGNRSVTQMVARRGGTKAPAKSKERDVRTMSEAEIQRELDRISPVLVELDPAGARWRELYRRSMELDEELQRRAQEAEERATAEGARDRAKELAAQTDRTSTALREELTYAMETLDDVAERLNDYVGRYDKAYDDFTAVLAAAKRDVAARKQREEMFANIVVGTGLGLTAAAIFAGARGVYRIITEAGTEAAELVFGKGSAPGGPDVFAPPASLDPKLRSGAAGERLLDAWRGLAKFNLTTHAFGEYRLAIHKLVTDMGERPTKKQVQDLNRIMVRGALPSFRREIANLHESVGAFSSAVRHPLLYKASYDIERDLWIRWMAALPGGKDERAKALDEDVIEDHLHKIGVLGGGDSRLDVDFGSVTTQWDTEKAFKAAKREEDQLNQIGRYGVAGEKIQPKGRGTVRVRNDLYEKLGRKPPEKQAPEGTFPAVLWGPDVVEDGQVVRVMGTTSAGLEVQPARDRDLKPVFI